MSGWWLHYSIRHTDGMNGQKNRGEQIISILEIFLTFSAMRISEESESFHYLTHLI